MSSVVNLRFSDFRRPDPGPPTARTVPFFPKSIRNREAELPLAHRPPASLSSLPYERQRESGQRKTPWLIQGVFMELAGLEPATSWVRFGRRCPPRLAIAHQPCQLSRFRPAPFAANRRGSSRLLDQNLTERSSGQGRTCRTTGRRHGSLCTLNRTRPGQRTYLRRVATTPTPDGNAITAGPFLISAEVAARLRCSLRTVHELTRLCEIPHHKLPGSRRCLFRVDELEAWEDGTQLDVLRLPRGGRVVRPRLPTKVLRSPPT